MKFFRLFFSSFFVCFLQGKFIAIKISFICSVGFYFAAVFSHLCLRYPKSFYFVMFSVLLLGKLLLLEEWWGGSLGNNVKRYLKWFFFSWKIMLIFLVSLFFKWEMINWKKIEEIEEVKISSFCLLFLNWNRMKNATYKKWWYLIDWGRRKFIKSGWNDWSNCFLSNQVWGSITRLTIELL